MFSTQFPTQDKLSASAKASLEANLAIYATLTGKTLESVEKLVRLNMAAAKATLEESAAAANQVMGARTPQECLAHVQAQAKPNLDKAISYGSQFFGIVSGVQSELSAAVEAQIAAANRNTTELMEVAFSKAPAGFEGVTAMFKSGLGQSGNGYEQMTRTAKQAMEAMEANLNSVLNQFARAATPASA